MLENISDIVWSIFVPLLLIATVYSIYRYIKSVHKELSTTHKTTFKEVVGPLAISLGSILGTGALIGVLGSIGRLYVSDQIYVEAIVGWSILGALFLVPLVYLEAIIAKVTKLAPKEYISIFLSKWMSLIYAVFIFLLYSVGFAGFQIQGIDAITKLFADNVFDYQINDFQVFFFLVIPILIFIFLILIAKNNTLFVNALSFLIGIATILYLTFAFIFMFETVSYLPTFFHNMLIGMSHPINSAIGIPIGVIVASQRIIQSSSLGIGAYGAASLESDSAPKAAGLIALFSSLVTIFIAIFVTTYVVSYGLHNGILDGIASTDSTELLKSYIQIAQSVTGEFGVVVIGIFTLFSGVTILLGSYYYVPLIFDTMERQNTIYLYMMFVFISSIIAVFGGTLVFGVVNSLLIIVTTINVLAMLVFYSKRDKKQYIKI